ncbi:phytanoyl-CoA hydroxylase-interacting protein-like isoform X2 [Argopecten irradians]
MLTDYHYSGGTDGLIVLLHQVYPPESFLVMFRYQPYPTYNLPFVLKPATEYKLQLFRVYTRRGKEDIGIGNSHSTVATFTTYMTQAEVRELYMKALAYLSDHRPRFTIITHFYRNKSDEYFTNIMTSNGVMYKYDKNWGGEQASSLNKQIKGLFFSANVDPVTMTPPDISYFGPVRLHIPTYLLLHDDINMYFSDFYCHTVKHKAQLVLTVKGSQTDFYCQQRLVLVDKRNNPFLMRAGYGPFEAVRVTVNITVELFYTEDVPIIAWRNMNHNVYFTRTKQKGKALAMVNGVPKNKDCRICNLDCFLDRLAHDLV